MINKLKISNIKVEEKYQIREKLNEDAIERYMEKYLSGFSKPLIIHKGTNVLVDGFHRLEAINRLKKKGQYKSDSVDVEYVECEEKDIRSKSIELNDYGVNLTNKEIDNQIGIFLEEGKVQVEIGKIFGISRSAIEMRIHRNPMLKKTLSVKTNIPIINEWLKTNKTHEEIRKEYNISRSRVTQILSEFKNEVSELWETGRLKEEIINKFKKDNIELTEEKLNEIIGEHFPKLILGDCYEELKKLPNECIDLILTDPPYNLSKKEDIKNIKNHSDIKRNFGNWDVFGKKEFINLFSVWAKESFRVLKKGGSCYIFTADRYLSYLRDAFETAGFNIKNTLIWKKTNPTPLFRGKNWVMATEFILFVSKGSPAIFNTGGQTEMHNIIICPLSRSKLHETQKPTNLLKKIIEVSSNPKSLVLDPFLGSGSTAIACRELNRNWVGIEVNKNYFKIAEERINGSNRR